MVTVDTTLWDYFINAGIVVKAVLVLLTAASVISWMYILQRGFVIRDARDATRKFEKHFWSVGDLTKVYLEHSKSKNVTGLETIFQAGFKEFLRLQKQANVTFEDIMQNVKRAMHAAKTDEQDKLELHLPMLATVGSTSPYVGLFGTVWGIMVAFRALASVQQATIAMVAPGIAEALIATAMGLFAAIPAVIAYNRYAAEIGRLLSRFDMFQEEFSNILLRQMRLNTDRVTAE